MVRFPPTYGDFGDGRYHWLYNISLFCFLPPGRWRPWSCSTRRGQQSTRWQGPKGRERPWKSLGLDACRHALPMNRVNEIVSTCTHTCVVNAKPMNDMVPGQSVFESDGFRTQYTPPRVCNWNWRSLVCGVAWHFFFGSKPLPSLHLHHPILRTNFCPTSLPWHSGKECGARSRATISTSFTYLGVKYVTSHCTLVSRPLSLVIILRGQSFGDLQHVLLHAFVSQCLLHTVLVHSLTASSFNWTSNRSYVSYLFLGYWLYLASGNMSCFRLCFTGSAPHLVLS